MLDRDKDAISAMLLSIATVAKNPLPMLLWAGLTWGLRSLAYKIAKNRKAHYVMLNIDAPGAVICSWQLPSVGA